MKNQKVTRELRFVTGGAIAAFLIDCDKPWQTIAQLREAVAKAMRISRFDVDLRRIQLDGHIRASLKRLIDEGSVTSDTGGSGQYRYRYANTSRVRDLALLDAAEADKLAVNPVKMKGYIEHALEMIQGLVDKTRSPADLQELFNALFTVHTDHIIRLLEKSERERS